MGRSKQGLVVVFLFSLSLYLYVIKLLLRLWPFLELSLRKAYSHQQENQIALNNFAYISATCSTLLEKFVNVCIPA